MEIEAALSLSIGACQAQGPIHRDGLYIFAGQVWETDFSNHRESIRLASYKYALPCKYFAAFSYLPFS